MGKMLPVGTKVWTVEESLSDRWYADMPYHFEVVSGFIDRVIVGGYKQYVVPTVDRKGRQSNLLYLKSADLGKSFFLTETEAIEYAEKLTDQEEKKSYNRGKQMLRPWRKEK